LKHSLHVTKARHARSEQYTGSTVSHSHSLEDLLEVVVGVVAKGQARVVREVYGVNGLPLLVRLV
jgi:hypothetical protein